MTIWGGQPTKADVEAVIGRYFGLLRVGKLSEAEELVDHGSMRHVLEALWKGSVYANDDRDEVEDRLAAREFEQDLSWLGELTLGEFAWGYTEVSLIVDIIYCGKAIEVGLGFHIRATDAGWVLSGPATYW